MRTIATWIFGLLGTGIFGGFIGDRLSTGFSSYAWSSPIEGGDKRRFFTVLHMGPVTWPVEAERAAIVAERGGASKMDMIVIAGGIILAAVAIGLTTLGAAMSLEDVEGIGPFILLAGLAACGAILYFGYFGHP